MNQSAKPARIMNHTQADRNTNTCSRLHHYYVVEVQVDYATYRGRGTFKLHLPREQDVHLCWRLYPYWPSNLIT